MDVIVNVNNDANGVAKLCGLALVRQKVEVVRALTEIGSHTRVPIVREWAADYEY